MTHINKFPATKRFQMCKQASRVASEWRVKFVSVVASVGKYKDYVISISEAHHPSTVRAFKCPTVPAMYLEVQCRVPDEYTVWIIIEQQTEEAILTYYVKYVTDVAKGIDCT
jgi:hypothetical protein